MKLSKNCWIKDWKWEIVEYLLVDCGSLEVLSNAVVEELDLALVGLDSFEVELRRRKQNEVLVVVVQQWLLEIQPVYSQQVVDDEAQRYAQVVQQQPQQRNQQGLQDRDHELEETGWNVADLWVYYLVDVEIEVQVLNRDN